MNHVDSNARTPGQLLKELLEQRGWSNRVLAVVTDISEVKISRILTDHLSVTAETALVLEEVFGVPAEQFLELQRTYDLAKARISARPDPNRRTRAHLYQGLPVSEMIKRGWLDASSLRDASVVEAALTKFFDVQSIDQIEILPFAAKKTQVGPDVSPAQIAWLYRAREIARELIVSRYSPSAVQATLPKLTALLGAKEEVRKVPRILSESGIRYVIVETLSSAKIDGACFWLDKSSPVIAMTLRYDRIDNFWFVLRHEIEHVLRQDGQTVMVLDAELEGDRAGLGPEVSQSERNANEAAADFCVPREMLRQFVQRKQPFFNERDILGFARTAKIHPGLVAGQLQYLTGRYDRFRRHLAKIRGILVPNAIVDGWGDVAPIAVQRG